MLRAPPSPLRATALRLKHPPGPALETKNPRRHPAMRLASKRITVASLPRSFQIARRKKPANAGECASPAPPLRVVASDQVANGAPSDRK
jgi:hypothetical protein